MTDLVVVSLEVWDEVWRRNQHLVAGVLRNGAVRRVLFIEPPVDVVHELRRHRLPGRAGGRLRTVAGPGLSPGQVSALRTTKLLPRRVDPQGDRRRARAIVRAASKLGMTSPVLWVNDPVGAELLAETGWASLYDITDDWLVADRPPAEMDRLRRQESFLMSRCDEVVVCSENLRSVKSVDRDVVLIPNAVDVDAYRAPTPRPDDLPRGPVALYLGTAHLDRLDVDLCVAVARRLAHVRNAEGVAHLVLVGPAPLPPDSRRRLTEAGVVLLGPRSSHRVPHYLKHADVLVVPHVITPFTASLDPIKAYEYRAAARPVVSTPVPGFTNVDDPLVTAVTGQDFPESVAGAISVPGPRNLAIPDDIPTWGQRASAMAEVLRRVKG